MERYHGRRAARIENAHVRVTVLQEGGHIAEILDKASGVNPLWTPPWPTIEPSALRRRPRRRRTATAPMHACSPGIMGHNLCLDIFGPPSDEEARRGSHRAWRGARSRRYELGVGDGALIAQARISRWRGSSSSAASLCATRVVVIRETLRT